MNYGLIDQVITGGIADYHAQVATLAKQLACSPSYPARLAANDVPVAAAVYFNDMYVPAEFSVPTARAIRGLKAWVTSEYDHSGLRVSNGAVLDRLIALARGTA